MILIERAENEPPKLTNVRNKELLRVQGIAAIPRPTKEDLGEAYQIVKDEVWEAQHYKCAFCECQEQKKRNDVEHFRPKLRALRTPGSQDDHGYWWLAWTWDNLLFSCRNCNQAPYKLDKFPLDVGSEALVPGNSPPGKERPLLIDPAEANGIDYIQFLPVKRGRREDWIPFARPGDPNKIARAQKTIEVCGLDRPDLIPLYNAHVKDVEREVEVVKEAIRAGDHNEVWEAWECAQIRLLSASQKFVALSYDVLDHHLPLDIRREWNLSLKRPPLKT